MPAPYQVQGKLRQETITVIPVPYQVRDKLRLGSIDSCFRRNNRSETGDSAYSVLRTLKLNMNWDYFLTHKITYTIIQRDEGGV